MKLGSQINISKGKKQEALASYTEGAYRYIQIDDLRNDDNIKYTFGEKGVQVNDQDILIAWDGANAGTIGYGLNGIIGSTIARLRLKKESKLYPDFLGLFLKSKFSYLRKTATGATIPHISRKALEKIELPDINFDDQKRIAKLLSDAEALIQKRKESIVLLDEFLKSTFLEMFGEVKIGYPTKQIQDITSKIVDCPHSTPKYVKNKSPYPCIRTSEIKDGDIDWSSMKYTDEKGYINRVKRLVPKEGDIVFAREGTVGDAALIPNNVNLSLGQRVMLFRVDKSIMLPEVFWASLRSPSTQHEIRLNTIGATVKRINISDVKKIELIIPPISKQKDYVDLVVKVKKLKTQFQQSLQELENLYGSLSQKAFKGELDLSRVEVKEEDQPSNVQAGKSTSYYIEENEFSLASEQAKSAYAGEAEPAFGEVKFSPDFLKDYIIKGTYQHESFHFEELWQEVQKFPFKKFPNYEKVKNLVFSWLKEEPAFLVQRFNEEKKTMELVVNEAAET
ncbi:restriction endonuclease subunit S [Roseivirga sp. BDSF3-8]|uniref:restriction endonuclease subunit S n=1 Tax=Roseivirga sp. BDSF3-8 TaxID=3241598 RepID=UPI003531ABD9